MEIVIWIVIVLIVLIGLCLIKKSLSKEDEIIYGLDDNGYREYVYRVVQTDFRPHLQQILNDIDIINSLRSKYDGEFSQASYNAMIEVYNKANDIENKIKMYWNSSQFNKDFSFYIGLHYASHLLGNAIKQEQQVIKGTFVQCKMVQKQWGDRIDELKYRKEKALGRQKGKISQEIAECCKAHKQISNLASQIGATNTKYNQRVTQQHMETAKRRDYIAEHFGKRGKRWKARMRKRALLRK